MEKSGAVLQFCTGLCFRWACEVCRLEQVAQDMEEVYWNDRGRGAVFCLIIKTNMLEGEDTGHIIYNMNERFFFF
jgi:hypothetical protein